MRTRTLLPLLSPALAISGLAVADPLYVAPRAANTPVLDGKLHDVAWHDAPAATGFVLNGSHTTAAFQTEFRVVYDSEAIYVAVTAFEPDLEGLETNYPENGGNIWWDDCVEVFLDPQATRVRYYQYILNAEGACDSAYTGDFAADLPCETAAGRTVDAWTLEAKIPFSGFGQAAHLGERWGFNVTRARNGKGPGEDRESSLWSPTDAMHGTPGRFGTIVFGSSPGVDPPRAEPDTAVLERILERIAWEENGQWAWSDEDLGFEARSLRARRLVALYPILGRYPDRRLLGFVRPAIRDEHILPWTVPEPNEIGRDIRLVACRSEFESATIGVFAADDLRNVCLGVGNLVSAAGNVLPASAADPYHVKTWYQAGSGSIHRGRTTLTPELLVRDPSIITTDPTTRTNIHHFDPIPDDADELQPIDIPAFETRQFWITWRVPNDAAPGLYRGELLVTADGLAPVAVPVRIRVPMWDLAPNPMLHGLYYGHRRPRLETAKEEKAFFSLIDAELRDQIEHGCNVVATYISPSPLPSDPSPFASFQRIHEIQRRYLPGIDTPFICIVTQVGWQEGEDLPRLTEQARELEAWARENGRDGYFFHGMDEASGPGLLRERPSFEAVRKGGAGVFVACKPSFFEPMGDVLNFANVTGRLVPKLAAKVHARGNRITSYGNPQVGVERPELYRRNYGLALRAAGYDGSVNYTYRGVDDARCWDDFHEDRYRGHNFAYPAVDGPIDTIQFEGWREGIDDIRYAETLAKAIRTSIGDAVHVGEASLSSSFLDGITGYEDDLDAVRAEIIRRIDLLATPREPTRR
jgi:hypothetical protein